MSGVRLYASTRKGLFILRADEGRRCWTTEGPILQGWSVSHAIEDPRDPERVYAAANHAVWGPRLAHSTDGGRTWDEAGGTPGFVEGADTIKSLWVVQPGHAERPGEVWCGVEPAALFRSRDWGVTWELVESLYRHPSREAWMPGGGGLILHGVVLHPSNPDSFIATISAGGSYRTDDGGGTWRPVNHGVRADFLPNPLPEAGQCVHRLVRMAGDPNRLFQQNHCGQFASEDGGETWHDVGEGLPYRFGFNAAAHPHEPSTVYAAPLHSDVLRAFADGAVKVWRSRDGGASWEPLTDGLPQRNAFLSCYRQAMVVDRCERAGVYLGTANGQIFASRDDGDTWGVIADYLPPVLALEVATDPA